MEQRESNAAEKQRERGRDRGAERGAESVASEKGLHPAGAEVEAAAVQLGRDTLVEQAAQAYLDLQCSQ